MTKLLRSMDTQSTVEIIPGILSISMQEALEASEVTDCFLQETASEIIGFIEEMSYYMGYLGVGIALPPLWKDWNSLLEEKIEGPIVNQILNAEYYYSGKVQADLLIAALGNSLDNMLWNAVTDLSLILGVIGSGGGPLAGALSGGGINEEAGAVTITVGKAALVGI